MSDFVVCGFYSDTSFNIYNSDNRLSNVPALEPIEDTRKPAFVVKYNSNGYAKWAIRLGSNIDFNNPSACIDIIGNVYVTGQYKDTSFKIYNSDGQLSNLPALYNTSEGSNTFLVKYDPHGYALWATQLEGNFASNGTSVSIDSVGNIYITGQYSDTTLYIYNSDRSKSNLRGLENNTLGDKNYNFIVKYNSQGYALWATRLNNNIGVGGGGPQIGNPIPPNITIDNVGNVYVTGLYSDTLLNIYDADGSTAHLPGLKKIGIEDNVNGTFVVKYDAAGRAQWGTRLGGNIGSAGNSVSVDSLGNVYVTGYYADTLFNIYDADGSTAHLPGLKKIEDNVEGTFIVKYDAAGRAQWGTRLGGDTRSGGNSVSIDSGGNVYVTGEYFDTLFNMYNSNGQLSKLPGLQNTTGNNKGDSFLVKYDPNGYALWGTRLGGDGGDGGGEESYYDSLSAGVSIDSQDNVYITGTYSDSVFYIYDANGGDKYSFSLQNTKNAEGFDTRDVFIVKYNSDGKSLWASRSGGKSESYGYSISCITPFRPRPIPNPVEPNICFPPGTLIFTDQGCRDIEKVTPGINTIGKKEIIHIVKTKNREKNLVCFEKDALSKNYPNRDLCMSFDHKILFQGKMIAAKYFLGHFDTKVKAIDYEGEYVYNILMEKHDKMTVHNCVVETLHPMNPIAQQYILKKGKKERKGKSVSLQLHH